MELRSHGGVVFITQIHHLKRKNSLATIEIWKRFRAVVQYCAYKSRKTHFQFNLVSFKIAFFIIPSIPQARQNTSRFPTNYSQTLAVCRGYPLLPPQPPKEGSRPIQSPLSFPVWLGGFNQGKKGNFVIVTLCLHIRNVIRPVLFFLT